MEPSQEAARRIVERLSEDERLRGSTTDAGFGPLLEWANAAALAYSRRQPAPETLDVYGERLRGVVQAAVAAAEAGRLDDPAALLDWEPPQPGRLQDDLARLEFEADPDRNAVKLAGVLQAALSSGPAVKEESPPAVSAPEPATPAPDPATSPPVAAGSPEVAASKETAPPASPGRAGRPEPRKGRFSRLRARLRRWWGS